MKKIKNRIAIILMVCTVVCAACNKSTQKVKDFSVRTLASCVVRNLMDTIVFVPGDYSITYRDSTRTGIVVTHGGGESVKEYDILYSYNDEGALAHIGFSQLKCEHTQDYKKHLFEHNTDVESFADMFNFEPNDKDSLKAIWNHEIKGFTLSDSIVLPASIDVPYTLTYTEIAENESFYSLIIGGKMEYVAKLHKDAKGNIQKISVDIIVGDENAENVNIHNFRWF